MTTTFGRLRPSIDCRPCFMAALQLRLRHVVGVERSRSITDLGPSGRKLPTKIFDLKLGIFSRRVAILGLDS